DPARIEAHDRVLAESHRIATLGDALRASLELLAELDPLRCQHDSAPRAVGAARDVLDDLTLEDPDLDADGAVRRLRRAGGVVDVGARLVGRPPPLAVRLGPRDLGAAQAARYADLDALRAHARCALHRPLHGAAERDSLLQLPRDVVADQLRRNLGPLDLLDVDRRFLAGELRQLVTQLVDLGAALADDDARPPGVHGDGDLARLALNVHQRDR